MALVSPNGSSTPVPMVRLMIVDGDAQDLAQIKAYVAAEHEIYVVAVVASAEEAEREAESERPHVVIVNQSLLDFDGIALSERLARQRPGLGRVLVLSQEQGLGEAM